MTLQHLTRKQAALFGGLAVLLLMSPFMSRMVRSQLQKLSPVPTTNTLIPLEDQQTEVPGTKTAIFAGGCFWGMEGVFEHVEGVSSVVSGYAGGDARTARYGHVSAGITQHAEAVKVSYDPSKITYEQLLQVYFGVAHDPTQLNRQGPDVGAQYRSAVFFTNEQQQLLVQSYIKRLTDQQAFKRPIVTQVAPLTAFYPAEDYHQNFILRNPTHPYVVVHDLPQIARLQKRFPEIYRDQYMLVTQS